RRPDVRDRRPGVDRLAGPGDAGGGDRGGIEGPRQYSSTELVPELYEHILNPRPFQEVHRLFKFIRVAARFPRPLATELSQLRQEFRLVARQPGRIDGYLHGVIRVPASIFPRRPSQPGRGFFSAQSLKTFFGPRPGAEK